MDRRLKLLFEKLKVNKLDGFLVSKDANVSYLSRFKSRDSCLLLSRQGNFFITDFRYIEEAQKNTAGLKVFQYKNLFGDIASLSDKLRIKRLGFEAPALTFAEYSRIKGYLRPKTKLVETYNIIEGLRQIKDKVELKSIREAIAITAKTFKFLKSNLRAGQTELQLAAEVEHFIRYHGAQMSAFDIIIASGPHSSFPHANISNRKIRPCEPILIDIGTQINGYKSDLTRVFFLDRIKPIHRKIYSIIRDAQAKAIEVIRPGVQFSRIDQACRSYLEKRGYARYFGHNLGHGVGLEIHEEPSISAKNKSLVKEGMVFTIEPGVYFPSRFGIRLEDMVYVTGKGVEVLSGAVDKSI